MHTAGVLSCLGAPPASPRFPTPRRCAVRPCITLQGCGYEYSPKRGDPEYPVAPGTQFQQLPADWQCPVCGAEKKLFVSKQRQVAGFAENQGYGLGTNSMTEGDKSLLIFGSLAFFFVLFLAGYALP
ncbi:Rubredoxin [Micractinium conductrix]|uniref:Rubredoxin n=1 Tax=Micractinium conductrix TaxID=554055 RepID=A0A2P6VLQ0_9CHLO|nr:Rubredoxin [Micractinium conductrix]|eukprot:PSC75031.1 Rubredoxin [Micractinium conductrix]